MVMVERTLRFCYLRPLQRKPQEKMLQCFWERLRQQREMGRMPQSCCPRLLPGKPLGKMLQCFWEILKQRKPIRLPYSSLVRMWKEPLPGTFSLDLLLYVRRRAGRNRLQQRANMRLLLREKRRLLSSHRKMTRIKIRRRKRKKGRLLPLSVF